MEAKNKKEAVSEVKANPLHNERIYIRFVPQKINPSADADKRHPAYGGLIDGGSVTLCVPVLRSNGRYKNILTNDEKDAIENALRLDSGALSVYKSENNYWDGFKVELTKEGMWLNLADPEDYLKYALIRANDDVVAPSVQERIDRPKATYRFEVVRTKEESSIENDKMDATMSSYDEFKKIKNDFDRMRVLVEILDGRPYSSNETPEFLRSRINVLIQADPKRFLAQIADPLLSAKVLIRRGTELGKLSKRGDFYYLKADNSPLCEPGEEPTLSIAARYLNLPSHTDIKFLLESEIDNSNKK